MRWLICYIDPKTGRERLGTGGDAQSFGRYVSVENVIRYALPREGYPPGQYHIYRWPEGTQFNEKQTPVTAYKRVPTRGAA